MRTGARGFGFRRGALFSSQFFHRGCSAEPKHPLLVMPAKAGIQESSDEPLLRFSTPGGSKRIERTGHSNSSWPGLSRPSTWLRITDVCDCGPTWMPATSAGMT